MPEEAANVNVTSALPDDIRESVAVANIKTIGEAPAFYSALAMGNSVSHQQRMQAITEASVGKIVESIINVSPTEAGGDVAALGQLLKGLALSPPPNTAVGA